MYKPATISQAYFYVHLKSAQTIKDSLPSDSGCSPWFCEIGGSAGGPSVHEVQGDQRWSVTLATKHKKLLWVPKKRKRNIPHERGAPVVTSLTTGADALDVPDTGDERGRTHTRTGPRGTRPIRVLKGNHIGAFRTQDLAPETRSVWSHQPPQDTAGGF